MTNQTCDAAIKNDEEEMKNMIIADEDAGEDFTCEVINLDSVFSNFADQKGPVKTSFKKITNYP